MQYTNRTIKNEIMLNTRYSHFVNQIVSGNSLYLEKNVTFNGTLVVTGDITTYGNLSVKNLSIQNDASIGNNLYVNSDVSANNYYARGNYYLDGYVLIPAGTIIQSAAINEPVGWFQCDGRTLDTTTYSALFNSIGYTFGGSGSNFLLPDMRGRTAVGSGQGAGLTNRTLGSNGGEETHILTVGEMPSHTHTGTTESDGTHTHTINDPGHTHTQTTINDDFNNSGGSPPGFTGDSAGTRTWSNINSSTTGITINSAGAHTHTFTTDSTGSGNAHNVMQPFIVLRYLIKY